MSRFTFDLIFDIIYNSFDSLICFVERFFQKISGSCRGVVGESLWKGFSKKSLGVVGERFFQKISGSHCGKVFPKNLRELSGKGFSKKSPGVVGERFFQKSPGVVGESLWKGFSKNLRELSGAIYVWRMRTHKKGMAPALLT